MDSPFDLPQRQPQPDQRYTSPVLGHQQHPGIGDPTPPARPGPKNSKTVGRILAFEGPRGQSARAAVLSRYVAYFLAIIGAAALNKAGLAHMPSASGGWKLLVAAIAFQLATATAGTVVFAHKRNEIVEQARHYVFGLTVGPMTGIAAMIWALKPFTSGGADTDAALQTLTTALPYLYYLPMLIVTIVFTRTIAGMRGIHRVTMDDEEMFATMTRNDGLLR